MRTSNNRVAIIGGARIPFTKSYTHYRTTSNSALLTGALSALVDKYQLQNQVIDEVILGTLFHYPGEWNYAREITIESGLHSNTPAFFIARACGTSLDAANLIALKIASGQIDVGIAGGCDTNSDIPIVLKQKMAHKLFSINGAKTIPDKLKAALKILPADLAPAAPSIYEPRTGLSMGEHTEVTVKKWGISREAQDELAYHSHMNAAKAYDDGFFDDLVFPFQGLQRDTILRSDTTIEKLAQLKPAFDRSAQGTLTAGNSSAYTDGASSVLLASEDYAEKHNLDVSAYWVDTRVAGVDYVKEKSDLLLAPVRAVPRLLAKNDLTLQDFDFYEIHEAFAGQVLATLKAWEDDEFCRKELGLEGALGEINRDKLNTRGSSIAVGHPFAATGTKVLAIAAKILKENKKGRCLISVCTAGGMGVAAIIER